MPIRVCATMKSCNIYREQTNYKDHNSYKFEKHKLLKFIAVDFSDFMKIFHAQ